MSKTFLRQCGLKYILFVQEILKQFVEHIIFNCVISGIGVDIGPMEKIRARLGNLHGQSPTQLNEHLV